MREQNQENQLFWLHLTRGRRLPKGTILKLLKRFGSVRDIYNAPSSDLIELDFLRPQDIKFLRTKDMKKCEKELAHAEAAGVEIITLDSEAYPSQMKYFDDAPPLLYAAGNTDLLNNLLSIAIVGSRRCTVYGIDVAFSLSQQLSRVGFTVISGLADGIDGSAHRGALNVNAPTIAVLGCGIDVVYPKCNKALYEKIRNSENGCIITEFPPTTRPIRINFPARNRIISGLSLGVVVVEAGERSGALITARLAGEQGKDVFAVPGNITSPASVGSNLLLRDGAFVVQSAEDIVSKYIFSNPELFAATKPKGKSKTTPAKQPASPSSHLTESIALYDGIEPEQNQGSEPHIAPSKSEANPHPATPSANNNPPNGIIAASAEYRSFHSETPADRDGHLPNSRGKAGWSPLAGGIAFMGNQAFMECATDLTPDLPADFIAMDMTLDPPPDLNVMDNTPDLPSSLDEMELSQNPPQDCGVEGGDANQLLRRHSPTKDKNINIDQQILDALSEKPLHIDSICRAINQSPKDVNAALTLLVIRGKVKEKAGRQYYKA